MKQYILAIFAIVCLITFVHADYTCTTQSYNEYRLTFRKTADLTPEQYQARFTKFCWSLRNVQALNAQASTATFQINQFSDFLEEDNKKLLNAQRPLGKGKSASEIPVRSSSLKRVGSAPPNWRNKASAIKDQGSCGSCWAFTSVGLYETFLMVKGKPEQDLSEEFILQCTDQLRPSDYVSDCVGGYTDFAFEVVQRYGLPREITWPYKGWDFGTIEGTPNSPGICSTTQNFVKYDASMGAKSGVNITRYDNVTVSKMETLLADGPVGALMMVDVSLQAYRGGVYTGCPSFANAFSTINHAVVIVGMDANKNYIIKNSWGPYWGEAGFGTISSVNDCALSAYVFDINWGYQVLGSSLILLLAFLVLAF